MFLSATGYWRGGLVRRGLTGLLLGALGGPLAARELSTDRPDQTESPYTVDAGRVQVELDATVFTFDRDTADGADLVVREWSVAPMNLKWGALPQLDLQLMVDPYVHVRTEDRHTGVTVRAAGMGDVTSRAKLNLWGNDGGATALAVMPFVKWPLAASAVRNGETEGGLMLPLAVALPGGWGLGAMTELDFVSDGRGGYETEWLNSVTFSRELTVRWGGYVELVAVTSRAPDFAWRGQFDLGLTYSVSADAQFDLGCNIGVTASAPDYQPFVGFSRRY